MVALNLFKIIVFISLYQHILVLPSIVQCNQLIENKIFYTFIKTIYKSFDCYPLNVFSNLLRWDESRVSKFQIINTDSLVK